MLRTKAARSTLSFSCFVIKGCDRSYSRNRGNTIRVEYKEILTNLKLKQTKEQRKATIFEPDQQLV